MKTWDDLSDFDVNKAVAIAVGHKCYYDRGNYTNDGKNVVVKGKGVVGWFDPCNNWADMGPIIDKNNITTGPCSSGKKMAASYRGGFDDIVFFDNKTCRAAAIVFLMMNGVKP